MITYLKICSSIVISLLVWVIIFTSFSFLSGGVTTIEALSTLLMVAAIGFFYLGILGSILWLIIFMLLCRSNLSELKKHFASSMLASLLYPALLMFSPLGPINNPWQFFYSCQLFILPVVIVSLFSYNKIYILKPLNKQRQHRPSGWTR